VSLVTVYLYCTGTVVSTDLIAWYYRGVFHSSSTIHRYIHGDLLADVSSGRWPSTSYIVETMPLVNETFCVLHAAKNGSMFSSVTLERMPIDFRARQSCNQSHESNPSLSAVLGCSQSLNHIFIRLHILALPNFGSTGCTIGRKSVTSWPFNARTISPPITSKLIPSQMECGPTKHT